MKIQANQQVHVALRLQINISKQLISISFSEISLIPTVLLTKLFLIS